MDMMAQALELGNRPHVVVATPGRIVDHLKSNGGDWDLSRIKFLVNQHYLVQCRRMSPNIIWQVLDEADRLLTSTFADDLSHLFKALPRERQSEEACRGNISPTTANFSIVTGSPGSLYLRPEHEVLLGDMPSLDLHGTEDDYAHVDFRHGL